MNIALLLTASRLFGAPLLAFLVYQSIASEVKQFFVLTSFIFFILLELTDAFDGYLARKRKEVTVLGKLLDPIADSLLHTTLLVIFLVSGVIPLWLFFIFMYRDSFLMVIRSLYASNNKIHGARMSGKIKTISLSIAFFFILLNNVLNHWGIHIFPLQLYGRHFGFYFLFLSACIALLSALDYAVAEWPMLKKSLAFKKNN